MLLGIQYDQENISMEKRRIRISSKRQITIPAKFFEALGLSTEVECIHANDMLILTPVKEDNSYFAEEILSDLIKQGYKGEKLLNEFKRINRQIRPSIEKIIEEADRVAEASSENYRDLTEDIFGSLDETGD